MTNPSQYLQWHYTVAIAIYIYRIKDGERGLYMTEFYNVCCNNIWKTIFICSALTACGGDTNEPSTSQTSAALPLNNLTPNNTGDITNTTLTNRNPDCAAYAGSYTSTINDIQQSVAYTSNLSIAADSTICTFTSNNIPDHDVGASTTTGQNFASRVTPNSLNYVVTVPRNPQKTTTASYVRKRGGFITMNGILLNGVDLDMDSAFCYSPSSNSIILTGCGLFADWYAVPAANPSKVTLDEYTGHPFDGRYHYHGDNHGLSNYEPAGPQIPSAAIVDQSGSPVIGYAPDGFPIYGHYFYDTQSNTLRKAKSSWMTHNSERTPPTGSVDAAPAIASFSRGTFVEDWFFSQGHGDLDECNGLTDAYGNYGYYYTEEYPYGPLCSFGTPDASFEQSSTAYNDGGVN